MYTYLYSIKSSRFEWLAEGIAAVFNKESKSVWFSKGKRRAKGILYNKYIKLRINARLLGQITVTRRSTGDRTGGRQTFRKSTMRNSRKILFLLSTEFSVESLLFKELRDYAGDINADFIQLWAKTTFERHSLFRKLSLAAIFEAFPCLSKEQGYKLVMTGG